MKLEKIKESNTLRDKATTPQRQQKFKKGTAKRIKTEHPMKEIKTKIKKEKKVSYCATQLYILLSLCWGISGIAISGVL